MSQNTKTPPNNSPAFKTDRGLQPAKNPPPMPRIKPPKKK